VQTWVGKSIDVIFDEGDLKISLKDRIALEGFQFAIQVGIIFL
jgi:hypothetical protein